ncbi:MAG: hypothetical protein KDB37_04640 [Ilumatobacter sp.]|nr:hypothetical protein [Ilumatobacter sp.]
MHRHTRRGLAMAGAFVVATALAMLVPARTGVWVPLHLFLAGALTSAIATVTQMLAVTWSASPAPPRRVVTSQQWVLAVGATLVVVGRESRHDVWTAVGGALVTLALTAVIAILIHVRRAARTPRFAPAIDAYVLALAGALTGIALGIGLGTGFLGTEARNAHVLMNLFAFVGVVIAGTLPYFAATQERSKMAASATPHRIRAVAAGLWLSAVAAASAAALGLASATRIALAAYGVGLAALTTLLPEPQRKHFTWAGPRLYQLFAGIAWWLAMTLWIAASYGPHGIDRSVLLALVIGAYGQVLAASLAYLVPVVRGGGHERLSSGFRTTRSWAGLVLGNLATVFALLGHSTLMAAALGVWVFDVIVRLAVAAQRSARGAWRANLLRSRQSDAGSTITISSPSTDAE